MRTRATGLLATLDILALISPAHDSCPLTSYLSNIDATNKVSVNSVLSIRYLLSMVLSIYVAKRS